MKRNIMRPILGLFLLLVCSLPLKAQQPFTNVIKFYMEPALATNVALISSNLVKYVADMNYILAKNTHHQLKYNPADTYVQSSPPFNQMMFNTAPTSNYEIRVWIQYSDLGYSWGSGEVAFDISGSAGIKSLFWHGFFNPNSLPYVEDFWDYRLQLSSLLHGYGQIYGVSMYLGDIYENMGLITDNTGVAPQSNIQMILPGFQWNYNDVYWGPNSDYYGCPSMGQFETTNRTHFLALHHFSGLHSTIIRKNHRHGTLNEAPFAATNAVYTKITDLRTCSPLPGARVRIWRINKTLPTALLVDQTTGTNGMIQWSWQSQFNNYSSDSVRMMKITRAGFPTVVKVLTTLDLQTAATVDGYTHLTNEIYMIRDKLKLSIRKSDRRVTVTNVTPGRPFALQGITDFNSGWTTITNVNPTTTNNWNYNHPAGAPPIRFYRTTEYAECPIPLAMMMGGSEGGGGSEQQSLVQEEVKAAVPKKNFNWIPKEIMLPPPPPPIQVPFMFKKKVSAE